MPLYDFKCECGFTGEFITHIDENKKCPECNRNMQRLMSPVNFNMGPCGAYGYYDDNLESYVSTNKQRRELMRQKGVTERGATPKTGEAWV